MDKSIIFDEVMDQTVEGTKIPTIDVKQTNGVLTHNLNIFKDICLRNKDNLNGIAIEINGNQMTYMEFFMEVEKYMKSFDAMGVKEGTVVSLCLPVSVEFICSYFALSTMGAICNAVNIGFIMTYGLDAYTEKRCSDILVCYDKYYALLKSKGILENNKLKNIIISSDSTYAHYNSDKDKIIIPDIEVNQNKILTMDEFLKETGNLNSVEFDINRPTVFSYTSGTTGKSKCMAHSDFAPLFMIASHDLIDRPNEKRGDRTLLTIPLQHPTGLFYTMCLQLGEGKTLVLEPRYDKTLFGKDIRDLRINHAVQAKPFYAQLISDYQNDILKPNDFIYGDGKSFNSPYSGGEGIPYAVCVETNKTLEELGSKAVTVGYGFSEGGSVMMGAYNIPGRQNTDGLPIPGVFARIVDENGKVIEPVAGAIGEIQLCSPIGPLGHCYLGDYNVKGKSDGSFIDKDGKRWSRLGDIATVVNCNGQLSWLVLGRAKDSVIKDGKTIYLFNIKEEISNFQEVKECEIINLGDEEGTITCHIVLNNDYANKGDSVIRKISNLSKFGKYISGVKFYDTFGINTTSGKCDREAMKKDKTGYRISDINGNIISVDFNDEKVLVKK